MYLIGIRKNYQPLGNAGTLITRYKSEKKIKEIAKTFVRMNNLDEVYLLQKYPQKLCELSMNEFVDYIRKNGKRIT